MSKNKNTKIIENKNNEDSGMKTFEVINIIFNKLYKKVSSDLRISESKSFDRGVDEIVHLCKMGVKDNSKITISEDKLKDVTFAINTIVGVVKRNSRQAYKCLRESEYIYDFLSYDDCLKLINVFGEIQDCNEDNVIDVLKNIKITIDEGVEASNRRLKEKYGNYSK
uniref:Four helix bundle protein n=1 Tax=Strongyloides stercoralis TaxID=6248 RepID=A0A0K0EIV5_STRER